MSVSIGKNPWSLATTTVTLSPNGDLRAASTMSRTRSSAKLTDQYASGLRGPKGNREVFVLLGAAGEPADRERLLDEAVA